MSNPDDIVVEICIPYPPDPNEPRGYKMQCFDPEELFCICGGIDDDTPMIECSNCADWFHCRCIGISCKKAEEIGFYACPFCAEILAADVPEEHRFTKNQVYTPLIEDSPPDGHHSGQHQLAENLQVPEDESDGQPYNLNQHLNVCFECKNSIENEDPLKVHDQRSKRTISFCSPKCRRIYRRNALEQRFSISSPSQQSPLKGRKQEKKKKTLTLRKRTESPIENQPASPFTPTIDSVTLLPQPEATNNNANAAKYTEIIRRNVRIGFESTFRAFNLSISPDLPDRLELSLWNHYGDQLTGQAGNVYKAKYRSLSYNLKDPKNEELRVKLAQNTITTDMFVTFTPDELANQEMTQEIRKLQELNLKNTILSTHFIQESIDIPELERLGNLNSENDGEPDVVSSSLSHLLCSQKQQQLSPITNSNCLSSENSFILHPDEREIVQQFASQYLNCMSEESSPSKQSNEKIQLTENGSIEELPQQQRSKRELNNEEITNPLTEPSLVEESNMSESNIIEESNTTELALELNTTESNSINSLHLISEIERVEKQEFHFQLSSQLENPIDFDNSSSKLIELSEFIYQPTTTEQPECQEGEGWTENACRNFPKQTDSGWEKTNEKFPKQIDSGWGKSNEKNQLTDHSHDPVKIKRIETKQNPFMQSILVPNCNNSNSTPKDSFFDSIRKLEPQHSIESQIHQHSIAAWSGILELPSVSNRMPFKASFVGSNCIVRLESIMNKLFPTPQSLVIEGILPVDHGLKYLASVLPRKPTVCFLIEAAIEEEEEEEGEVEGSFDSIYDSLSNDFKIGVVGHVDSFAKDVYLVPWSSSIRYPAFDGNIRYLSASGRCSDLSFFLLYVTLRGQFLNQSSRNSSSLNHQDRAVGGRSK